MIRPVGRVPLIIMGAGCSAICFWIFICFYRRLNDPACSESFRRTATGLLYGIIFGY